MKRITDWLAKNHGALLRDLTDLVAVPSISTDGEHGQEIEHAADLTCEQMERAGLENVTVLHNAGSNPYAYGEWLGAPGKPTIFLYAHYDVQPVNFLEEWKSDPWRLTQRGGRLFGRGTADDKGAITAQLGAVAAFLKTKGSLPVNVKMLVEGEEEASSNHLEQFLVSEQRRLHSDVIVVCDTENLEVGLPSITYSLRGIVTVLVEVQSAQLPVHSGMVGGVVPDAALALDVILARLYDPSGTVPIPHFYDSVRLLTSRERRVLQSLTWKEEGLREELGIPPTTRLAGEPRRHAYEQIWRRPTLAVIAQEASSIRNASNQILHKAAALLSCRIVPDQDPAEVFTQLQQFLTQNPPWEVSVTVKSYENPVNWWITDPVGPAFEAALAALRAGYERDAVPIGCGGTIGFVGPLVKLFGEAPALLLGIEDPHSNAHGPNESLHEGDWHKLQVSLAHLFENLGMYYKLTGR